MLENWKNKMINYTETPHLQSASKNIMAALQSKHGIDQILELNDKLVLIGKDWCYKSDDGLQLVERELAAKLCMRLAEKTMAIKPEFFEKNYMSNIKAAY